MPTLHPVSEVDFTEYGGAEVFVADVDGDGRPEIVTYQGPGVFGARAILDVPSLGFLEDLLPAGTSVSAFRFDGSRLWTWGEPNQADRAYACHSAECVIACADVDDDGAIEVVVADGARVVALDGVTGREKVTAELPEDNYYVVGAVGEPTGAGEAAVVVKNGETGYGGWRYGEPVIGLDSTLGIVWGPTAIQGGGHHISALDLDADGRKDYLIGYCAVAPDGRILWRVDAADPARQDAVATHVDYADTAIDEGGELILALAGSDRFYAVTNAGRTLWNEAGPHAQGVALGRFREGDDLLVACYNAPAGPLVLRDLAGNELWSRTPERVWPDDAPEDCLGRRYHKNRPIVTLAGAERSWIGYADGAWPWGMDGDGEVALAFAPPENWRIPEWSELPDARCRGDDVGYGFALQTAELDGGRKALIYNRRFLWVYELE